MVKDYVWCIIFWICLVLGLLFCVGIFWLFELLCWLVCWGCIDEVCCSLQCVLFVVDVEFIFVQIQVLELSSSYSKCDLLFSCCYVVLFLFVCVVLVCIQVIGINLVLVYVVNIFNQVGLFGLVVNGVDVVIKLLNVVMIVVVLLLVDCKGCKFLLMFGSGGICVVLLVVVMLFFQVECGCDDVQLQLQVVVSGDGLQLVLDDVQWQCLSNGIDSQGWLMQLIVLYVYGDFINVCVLCSDNLIDCELCIECVGIVQVDSVIGVFFCKLYLNLFVDFVSVVQVLLCIEQVCIGLVLLFVYGWVVVICILVFVVFFVVGLGVCVWLVLLELMLNCICFNGMSIVLLINQFVFMIIVVIFLFMVGYYGYVSMFVFWVVCIFVFFLVVVFWLLEIKGKLLEEIEVWFVWQWLILVGFCV